MRIFNSLTRKVEDFEPMKPPVVKMYTCGPTVYNYPTIGNWRTYVTSDLLVRALKYTNHKVDFVMNLTDVGHLVSDGDTGEDKLEKGARREGKSAWEVARFYTEDFLKGFSKLNLTKPMLFSKATDHIKEQIELVEQIEKAGFTYKTSDGIYFDVAKYESAGNKYGQLSSLDEIREGARVEVNTEKNDPRDFALWKFSPKNEKRDMEWSSPWGMGFPGWHIECSAMSMKYLGEQLDIHVGGEDLMPIHHPNEVAQSEAATGKKPFSKYWVHGAFLLVDGGKMGKSLGNAYTLEDIEKRGFEALALRYFFLTAHYRKQLNFTWESLKAGFSALEKLRMAMVTFRESGKRTQLSAEKLQKIDDFRIEFGKAIDDDLNMPNALAVIFEVVKSNIPEYDKYELIENFDEVLGLDLANYYYRKFEAGPELLALLEKREKFRLARNFAEADKVRGEIESRGFQINDMPEGAKLVRK